MNCKQRRNERRLREFLRTFEGIRSDDDVELAVILLNRGNTFDAVVRYFQNVLEAEREEKRRIRAIMRKADEEAERKIEAFRRLPNV